MSAATPGAIGMAHYAKLCGDKSESALPLYATLGRRYDGRPRITGEYTDPQAALAAADILRQAGDKEVEVVLITSIEACE